MKQKNKIYLKNLSPSHISKGWLKWINSKDAVNGLSTIKSKTKKADLIKYLKISKQKKNKVFAVYDKSTNAYIGNASLTEIDNTNRHCKYGRFLGNFNFSRKGYGQMMLLHLFRYAFFHLKLNKCYTLVFTDNVSSIRSNRKFGLKEEGILRQHVLKNKKYRNVIVFSMLKSEFKKKYGK